MSEIKSFYFIAKHYSKKCTLTGLQNEAIIHTPLAVPFNGKCQ